MISDVDEFVVYSGDAGCMTAYVKDEKLMIESEVYGEDDDSELIYRFSKKDTKKIFAKMTLEELTDHLRETHTFGLEKLMDDLGIDWDQTVESDIF